MLHARGVLQDAHWSGGGFGYFPTYLLGSVLAVQIWEKLEEAIPDVEEQIERGDFSELHAWLRENIYALGRKLTLRVEDVMLRADCPSLPEDATMRRCIVLLAEKRGTVPIVDRQRRVLGVVTAGDLTRLMEREEEVLEGEVLVTSARRLVLSEGQCDLDLGADTHSAVSSLSLLN